MPSTLNASQNNIPWDCRYIASPSGSRLFTARALHDGCCKGLVIVSNPIGEEAKSSFSIVDDFCRQLWNAGWDIVRYDYAGTGDSEGDFEATSAKGWVADCICVAQDALANMAPPLRTVMMGVRLGANIAAHAVEAFRGASGIALALWEPIVDLDAHIRHLRWVDRSPQDAPCIDHFGWILTEHCLGSIRASLTLSASNFALPSFVANITTRNALTRDFESVRPWLTSPSKLLHARNRPFWEMIGDTSCQAMIDETIAWLQSLKREGEPC